jgi:hypothetical protein
MTKAAKSYTLINDQTGEAVETISADDFVLRLAAPDLLDTLLDAKRYLEKAQDEVYRGDNEVDVVSFYVNEALACVMKGLPMGR